MLLKIVWSEADKAYEMHEISNIYTENDYLEAAIGKDKDSLQREIIVSEGQYWLNCKADAEFGDDGWEKAQVLTDTGFVLWEVENLDIELVKNEKVEA